MSYIHSPSQEQLLSPTAIIEGMGPGLAYILVKKGILTEEDLKEGLVFAEDKLGLMVNAPIRSGVSVLRDMLKHLREEKKKNRIPDTIYDKE